jgi:hypothetical protein
MAKDMMGWGENPPEKEISTSALRKTFWKYLMISR